MLKSGKLSKKMLTTKQQIEARGVQQGMQRGIQQGMQQERFSLARNMLRDKAPQEQVMKWTGLSTKELQGLMKA